MKTEKNDENKKQAKKAKNDENWVNIYYLLTMQKSSFLSRSEHTGSAKDKFAYIWRSP